MATSLQWYLHGLHVAGSTWITQLTDLTPAATIAHLTGYASGAVFPSFRAAQGVRPEFRFSTPQIQTVLDLVGLPGLGAAASNTDLYFKQSSNLGSRVAYGESQHIRLRVARWFLYWTRISASQDGEARIECRLVPVFDGTNVPIVAAGSLAIPADAVASEFYTLGPVSFNGAEVADVQDWSLDLGARMIERASSGQDFLTYCGVQSHDPVLTLSTGDLSKWTTLGLSGVQLTAAAFYLRKRQADQTRCYADGSAQHVKFSGTDNPCGIVTIEQSSGAMDTPGTANLRAALRVNSAASAHPLTLDTASAIT